MGFNYTVALINQENKNVFEKGTNGKDQKLGFSCFLTITSILYGCLWNYTTRFFSPKRNVGIGLRDYCLYRLEKRSIQQHLSNSLYILLISWPISKGLNSKSWILGHLWYDFDGSHTIDNLKKVKIGDNWFTVSGRVFSFWAGFSSSTA